MKTPYEILGVSPGATDEEIKQAYRALARKYHPDKYRDSDLADLATEKMKEINAAYEEIQNARSTQSSQANTSRGYTGYTGGAYGTGGYENTYSGGSRTDADTAAIYSRVRAMLNRNEVLAAEQLLGSIEPSRQGAEWQYLMGCVLYKRGYFLDAQKLFDRACDMDPQNPEYQNARKTLKENMESYGGGYRTASPSGCLCDCCGPLLCADCCCNCFGGDLIPCC